MIDFFRRENIRMDTTEKEGNPSLPKKKKKNGKKRGTHVVSLYSEMLRDLFVEDVADCNGFRTGVDELFIYK
jgi:hypothetical protein